MLILLALLALCRVAAHDTSGYASGGDAADSGPPVRVGDGVAGIQCAQSAAELAPLLAVTLEPDVATWRRSGGGAAAAPYTLADWEELVRGGADQYDGERLVLIYNNSWYYYLHARASAVATPRGATPEAVVPYISSWVTATQWWFEEAVTAWNMTFPDCVFNFDVNDEGYCVPPRVCSAPSFALWRAEGRGATDILLPYMVGINHSTYDVPWAAKESRAFFRGRRNEHAHVFPNGSSASSRSALVALSAARNDTLDARFVEGNNSAPEVPIRDHARRKYLLALDGVTGSFRFSRLLSCNSLVLKEASPWQEYFYRGLTPGIHYQSVFEAAPDDVLGVVARAQANESGSQAMARAGQAFAVRYLCPRARMTYFKAALEAYVRLFVGDSMGAYARDQAWPAALARIRGEAALAKLRVSTAAGTSIPAEPSAKLDHKASITGAQTPFFSGVRCFPNCEYSTDTCPATGVCLPNSSCVLWRLGEFAPSPAQLSMPPPCAAVDTAGTFDAAGAWVPAHGGPCTPTVFSPAQAYAALRGRHVAFGGDSLMRQLFVRLVAHLRGFSAAADRAFHVPALYRRNATHDSLHIAFRPQSGEGAAQPPPLPRREPVTADEVLLTFDWAPSHNAAHADGVPFTTPVEELLASANAAPPVVVYGIIYWRDAVSLDDELAALQALAARSSRLLWVTTPEEPGASAARNAEYTARNAAMRVWAAAQTPAGRVRVLPLDALAAAAQARGPELRPSGVHFGCTLRDGRGSDMGAYAHAFAPMVADAETKADCRDVVDLALAQLLLNAMQD